MDKLTAFVVACVKRQLVKVRYNNDKDERTLEVHVVGHLRDNISVLTWDADRDVWRRLHVHKVRTLRIVRRRFPGSRECSGPHSSWDVVYAITPRPTVLSRLAALVTNPRESIERFRLRAWRLLTRRGRCWNLSASW